jgi:hypothetical protein
MDDQEVGIADDGRNQRGADRHGGHRRGLHAIDNERLIGLVQPHGYRKPPKSIVGSASIQDLAGVPCFGRQTRPENLPNRGEEARVAVVEQSADGDASLFRRGQNAFDELGLTRASGSGTS